MNVQHSIYKLRYLAILFVLAIPGIFLLAAPSADPTAQPLNFIAPPGMSSFNVGGGNAVAYAPWFENGTWQGDVRAFSITSTGAIGTQQWSALQIFADTSGVNANDNAAPGEDYWNNRVIVATDGGYGGGWTGNKPDANGKIPFRYYDYSGGTPTSGTVLHQTQQGQITSTSGDQNKFVKFIRGYRSDEKIQSSSKQLDSTDSEYKPNLVENSSGTLRERYSILGDIIHSSPKYVGPPSKGYTFDNYLTFKSNNSGRAGRVYMGANDGMLHAFDAATGQEIFAYIPSMVMSNLGSLTTLSYTHTYFVDGELAAEDAYVDTGSGTSWHTILVGALGAGGKGFFALDVTTPPTTTDTEASAKAKILWEIGAPGLTADADLGYTLTRPTITKLKNGKWVAIVGNGYESTNGHAVLYFIDLATGAVVTKDTGSGSVGDKNGLSSPTVVDANFDDIADYVYAGDLNGDLWRFDLTAISSSGTPIDASEVTFYKLFDGVDTKPITSAPDIQLHPNGGFMVFFGTGRAITDADITDTTVQSIYGLRDQGSAIATPDLVTQTYQEMTYPLTSEEIRLGVSNSAVDYTLKDGWKVDLPAGERLLSHMQVRGGRVQFNTTRTSSGVSLYENWLTQLDSLSGGAPLFTVFDLDQDGDLDNTDRVAADGDGDVSTREDIPAAVKVSGTTPIQVASQPVILFLASGIDTILIINEGLTPIVVEPCFENCDFRGGHIDVDTDSPSGGTVAGGGDGLGGKTDAHVHEYDKNHGQVYVDYFSLEPRRGLPRSDGKGGNASDKLNRVTEVYERGTTSASFDGNTEFIVLIANADLSPGGDMTLGGSKQNVLDYQRAIISKIQASAAGDTSNGLKKSNDVHTLTELLQYQGTTGSKQALSNNWPIDTGDNIAGALRIAFNSSSIVDGDLHPTNTGCVRDNDNSFGRWRNGALTIHLLEVDTSVSGWQANVTNKVVIQNFDAGDQVQSGETYTGVRVKDNADFLYESTMFYHYEDNINKAQVELNKLDSSLYPGVTKLSTNCYGDATWVDDVDRVRNPTITEAEFNQLIDDLNTNIAELEASGDQKKADKLKEIRDDLISRGTGGGTPIIQTPGATTGGLEDRGNTPGAVINTGTRSWREFGVY